MTGQKPEVSGGPKRKKGVSPCGSAKKKSKNKNKNKTLFGTEVQRATVSDWACGDTGKNQRERHGLDNKNFNWAISHND